MNEKLSPNVKKNLLDLHYNKYLQYYTTSIIIIFTYFIGIVIALWTKQIDWSKGQVLLGITLVSGLFLSVMTLKMSQFKDQMNTIIAEIKKLER